MLEKPDAPLGGNESVGSLAGGFNVALGSGTLSTGNDNTSTAFAGVVSGAGGLTKVGSGTFTISGANTYSGATTISGGTIALAGSGTIGSGGLNLGTAISPGELNIGAIVGGTYALPATADLTGVGTLAGNGKTLALLGSFAPGNGAGTISLGAGLALDLSNSVGSLFEIGSPAYSVGTYDFVNGGGSVIFGGILNLNFSGGSYADGWNVLQLFANLGGFGGDFTDVVSTGLAEGQHATFNAATGSISINGAGPVPEIDPSGMGNVVALVAGVLGLLERRRLKAKLAV